MLKIPFYKPSIGAEEIDEVVAALKSGWLTTGPRTKQFEREFAGYLKHKHAIAVNSCTAALHLALEAIGIKAGQGVIVPTMTFAATAEVVRYFGACPILVDCRVEDFNLDVADAERKIQSALTTGQSIAAIMPVHYGGQVGDVEGVRKLAQKYHLKIVEDAAHCCPAYYRDEGAMGPRDNKTAGQRTTRPAGSTPHPTLSPIEAERVSAPDTQLSTLNYAANGWTPVGSSADITCFSFYANKCITTGEGGMACTNSEEYADRMRIMSLHGISKDAWKRFTAEGSWYYEIVAPGYKYNMTDIAAAIGIHQLRRADELHQKRRKIAGLYTRLLEEVEELILPRELPNRIHSWHLYAIRLKLDRLKLDRAQVIQQMKERGIGTSVHWMPLHMHPYYREKYAYKAEDFPVAANLYPQLITLPLYPDMKQDEVEYVCDSIKDIMGANIRSKLAGLVSGCREKV
jgi:perosamine synthetase